MGTSPLWTPPPWLQLRSPLTWHIKTGSNKSSTPLPLSHLMTTTMMTCRSDMPKDQLLSLLCQFRSAAQSYVLTVLHRIGSPTIHSSYHPLLCLKELSSLGHLRSILNNCGHWVLERHYDQASRASAVAGCGYKLPSVRNLCSIAV